MFFSRLQECGKLIISYWKHLVLGQEKSLHTLPAKVHILLPNIFLLFYYSSVYSFIFHHKKRETWLLTYASMNSPLPGFLLFPPSLHLIRYQRAQSGHLELNQQVALNGGSQQPGGPLSGAKGCTTHPPARNAPSKHRLLFLFTLRFLERPQWPF